MNKFQSIKISLIHKSSVNVRGKSFDGSEFNDLVASIKEKGVLVPIIVRQISNGEYEIVAGRRRIRAAKVVGLEKIPAIIKKLTDNEAKEVQIIENLQRLDVHPLDEGLAYRQLIEKSFPVKYSVDSIAVKVGKSKDYIRQRLFLTNLNEKSAKAYREGKITDGHAVLIAKLSPNDQSKAMKYLRDEWALPPVQEFKKWIEQEFYHPLAFQPWLKDKEVNKAVGKCIECPPNKNSLFGDIKEGACVDLKCWGRKMGKYVDYQVAKAKEQGIELLKVSKEYSYSPQGKADAGILTANDYTLVSFKKKKRCEYAQKAIVAVGSGIGTFLWICASSDCPEHHPQHADYSLSPKEKERRRKEVKKQKAKREKEEESIVKALEKIKWPLNKKTLDTMFELVLNGQGTTVLRPVAKRFEITAKKVTKYDYTSYDWEIPIREAAKKMSNAEKLRFIIGVMLERTWGDFKNKILKVL